MHILKEKHVLVPNLVCFSKYIFKSDVNKLFEHFKDFQFYYLLLNSSNTVQYNFNVVKNRELLYVYLKDFNQISALKRDFQG